MTYNICRKAVLFTFLLFSMGGIISGMIFGLSQSPQSQAEQYLSLADKYAAQAKIENNDKAEHLLKHSEEMVLTAISYTPYNDAAWKNLDITRKNYHAFLKQKFSQSLAFSSIKQ